MTPEEKSKWRAELDLRKRSSLNRAKFDAALLTPYSGQWIAWSPDGARIVAHATEPQSLDDLILAVGEDPEECLVEGIPAEDSVIGGLELDREPA